MMETLITQIRSLRKEVRATLPFVREEIDGLIRNKETSTPQIEKTLDLLLSFISLGYGAEEFQRLNAYYYTINPEYSDKYGRIFKEYFHD